MVQNLSKLWALNVDRQNEQWIGSSINFVNQSVPCAKPPISSSTRRPNGYPFNGVDWAHFSGGLYCGKFPPLIRVKYCLLLGWHSSPCHCAKPNNLYRRYLGTTLVLESWKVKKKLLCVAYPAYYLKYLWIDVWSKIRLMVWIFLLGRKWGSKISLQIGVTKNTDQYWKRLIVWRMNSFGHVAADGGPGADFDLLPAKCC